MFFKQSFEEHNNLSQFKFQTYTGLKILVNIYNDNAKKYINYSKTTYPFLQPVLE